MRARINREEIGSGSSELNCYDAVAEEAMKQRIQEAMAQGDTLGGVFEVIVRGAPLGLNPVIFSGISVWMASWLLP